MAEKRVECLHMPRWVKDSTQIAFAITDNLTGPDYMHIKLYGYPYNVYTHSFLCYGNDEVESRILDKIIQVHTFSIRR